MAPPRKPLTGPDDPRHGTTAGYRIGCRCDDCRDAVAAKQRQQVARNMQRAAAGLITVPHGTTGGYVNYQCRCQACRQAWAADGRRMKARRRQLLTEGVEVTHGRRSTYTDWGCRCQPCRDAWAAYVRGLRQRHKQAVTA